MLILPKLISLCNSGNPPLKKATRYLEYPPNISSAPSPLSIILALLFTFSS